MATTASIVRPVIGRAPAPLPGAADWLATWMHVRAGAVSGAAAHAVVDAFRASVEGPFGWPHATLPDAIAEWIAAAGAQDLVPDFDAG